MPAGPVACVEEGGDVLGGGGLPDVEVDGLRGRGATGPAGALATFCLLGALAAGREEMVGELTGLGELG